MAAACIGKLHISISHCRSFAVAHVIAEGNG
jgi:phosphopantetheinyl transferase (holo-ACP synthase)